MNIGHHNITDPLNPYVIAEIGVNHEGNMELAKRLIEEAKAGGAHAAKFQSYKAGKIASKHSPAYWDLSKEPTTSQYELFQKYDQFGPEEYQELARHCGRVGIEFMSTPFDLDAVDFLEPLMPAFKVASADLTNVPLLRKVAKTGKPVVLSTGASTMAEVADAVGLLEANGVRELALLHCVLNYPTPEENANLGMISVLKRVFPQAVIGYSDHVVPDETISALEVAVLLGASVLEKHFTHDKSLPGNDHYHAMDWQDLQRFLAKVTKYRVLMGKGAKDLSAEDSARKQARRSIVAARVIAPGERLTEENLIVKRPGHGISPLHWDEVIGKTVSRTIEEDQLLQWPDLVV